MRPYIFRNASRLYFGTAPEPKQKDTTLLAENRPDVQVWSWDEKVQYTQQSFNKATDLKRSYTAIYNLGSGRLLQLATEELPTLQTADEGNAHMGRNSIDVQLRTSEHRSMYSYVRLSIDRCTATYV